MPRQARLDSPGTFHHVILRGIEKRRIVDDKKDREDFVSRMGELSSETKNVICAWSLMTNHAHILIRSGPIGLPGYMRRLLTGYAINYNRRHKRHGHLFQNRYKSIVVDEDAYFQELVRYIHLNPLRAGLVKDLRGLDRYPWCGHSVIIGKRVNEWQDRNYVLSWFGENEKQAKMAYRSYIREGISEGKRPDLVGGGLIRSLGGWSEVLSLRKSGEMVSIDERILGSGTFVERILQEADERIARQFFGSTLREKTSARIKAACKEEGINLIELKAGGRRGRISKVRSRLAIELVEKYGLPQAETARQLGVSTSAISKILIRHKDSNSI